MIDYILLILISIGAIHAIKAIFRVKARVEIPVYITKSIQQTTKSDATRLILIIGLCSYFAAFVEILNSSPMPDTKMLGEFTNYIYTHLGYRGVAVFYALSGLAIVLFVENKKSKNA